MIAECPSVGAVTNQFRTLLLMRHAKSDYPAGVADHQRPLALRGEREAGLAGDWLRAHTPSVDAVLCSTATRTRQTLARTLIDAPVTYSDRLYDATPGRIEPSRCAWSLSSVDTHTSLAPAAPCEPKLEVMTPT